MSQQKSLSLLLTLVLIISPVLPQSFCRTPGLKMGRCLSIYDCDYLLQIIQSNSLTQETIRFLQLSQCDAETDNKVPHVCCARNDDSLILESDMNTTHLPALSAVFEDSKTIKKESEERLDDSIDSGKGLFKLLPSRSVCGRETVENRIYSGQDTKSEEFPWTALLEYRTISNEITINCGGSLISKKYVLTAAHCLTGDITVRVGSLENIRLGDYDLRQSDSCDVKGRRCGNPQRFNEIDEIIPHENFNHRAINRRNDIGLVRLKKAVKFSKTIQPVCLPIPNTNSLKAGDSVYVAGFGRTLQSRTSPVKQKLRIPVFDQNQCKQKFATKKVEIHNDQLCAGGEFSRDACDEFIFSDSGNGLIRFQNNWIVEGIVSFGYLCGLQGWPAIYTRVDKYIDWIENHMRA